MFKKTISLILSISLILTQPVFAQGVAELNIGKYLNQMPVVKTDSFRPARLRYVSYDIASNDFKLLLDQGDELKGQSSSGTVPDKRVQESTQELFNYFLIGLSLPNEKFWVNLRPDAPEQIIDPLLEKTDVGKIMLEADLELKKDTAGLTSPQNPEGKEYWDKLYKKAGELFGTENITIPTITRPWIVPGEVIIRESEDSAYIYKANLKVMLEEDYLRGTKDERRGTIIGYGFNDPRMKELNKYSTQLIKELILPRLTQEINTSKKYARLRQVFFSLILSRWFKDKFKDRSGQYSNLIDSRNLDKLGSQEAWSKDYYFNEYKKSFHQGEYNLKEQIATPTGQVIRSYVSGGANLCFGNEAMSGYKAPKISSSALSNGRTAFIVYGIFVAVLSYAGVGTVRIIDKMKEQEAVIQQEKIAKAKNIIPELLWEDLYDLYFDGKLQVKDYVELVNIFKNTENKDNRTVIEDAMNYIDKVNNLRKPEPEVSAIILKLREVLQSLSPQGSSPLSSEEIGELLEEHFEAKNHAAASSIEAEASREIIHKIKDIAKRVKNHFGWYYYSDSVYSDLNSYYGPRTRSYDKWISAIDKIKNFLSKMPHGNDEEFIASTLAECNNVLDRISVVLGRHFYDDRLKQYFSADAALKTHKGPLDGIIAQVNNDKDNFYKFFPFNKQALISIIENYDDESWPAFIQLLNKAIEENKRHDFKSNMRSYYGAYNNVEGIKNNIEDYNINSIALGLMYYRSGYEIKKTETSLDAIKSYFNDRRYVVPRQEDIVVLTSSSFLPKKLQYALIQAFRKSEDKIPGWRTWVTGNIKEFQEELEQSVGQGRVIAATDEKRVSQLLQMFIRSMVLQKKFAYYLKHLSQKDLEQYLAESDASHPPNINEMYFNRIMDMSPYDFKQELEAEIKNILSGGKAILPEFLGAIWQLYCHTLVGEFISEYKSDEDIGRNVLIIMARAFFDYDTDSQIFKDIVMALRNKNINEYLEKNISMGVNGVSDIEEHLAMAYEHYLDSGGIGSSPLAPEEGASSAIVLEDEFKALQQYFWDEFARLKPEQQVHKHMLNAGMSDILYANDFKEMFSEVKKIIAQLNVLLAKETSLKEAYNEVINHLMEKTKLLQDALKMEIDEYIKRFYKKPYTEQEIDKVINEVVLQLISAMKSTAPSKEADDLIKITDVWEYAKKFITQLQPFLSMPQDGRNVSLDSSKVALDEEFNQIQEYLWDSLADLERGEKWRSLAKGKDWFHYKYRMSALLDDIANARKFHELFIVRNVPTQIAALKVTLKYNGQKALAEELDKIIKELYSKAKELKRRLEDDIKENKNNEGDFYQKQSAMGSLNLFLKNAPSVDPGSSPLTLDEATAEFKKIVDYHSDVFDLIADDQLENIFQSNDSGVFLERILIVASMIAYELAYSKKSNEMFKSEIISALIELMGKCKYGKQLSSDEEIIKEMKAIFSRKMERLNAISLQYTGDKMYPSWGVYVKEMREVAHRDVETPKKAELKKIVSSFEKNFSVSQYVAVFSRNLTIVGDLAEADISEYLELKILLHAITKASSSVEAVLDIKNQETGNEVGGIDFCKIDYLTQPMGSFQGLDLRLPLLSKAELEGIDINRELAAVEQMVNARIDVSTDRLKRLLAAMSQKDAFTSQRETQLLPLLLRLCWLKEEKGAETTPDFRAVLLIADTGLFVEQGTS